ncbi:MAG: DnaJ domain-containing protein [Crocinitomicaceae bacterium]
MADKYYHILGLQPGASQEDIKKAYRQSAMKYHPDREGGDAEKFLLIFEAYEYLTTNPQSKGNLSDYEFYANQANAEDTIYKRGKNEYTAEEFEEKLKWAKQKYQEKKYQEAIEDDRYYKSLITGWKIKYFWILSAISFVLAIIFLLDNVLEPNEMNSFVTYKDTMGEHVVPTKDVRYVEIDGQPIFVALKDFPVLFGSDFVVTTKTPIFNEIKTIEAENAFGENVVISTRFSVVSTFPLVFIILILPISVILWKKRSPLFVFLYLTCAFIFPLIISMLLLINDRIFKLF